MAAAAVLRRRRRIAYCRSRANRWLVLYGTASAGGLQQFFEFALQRIERSAARGRYQTLLVVIVLRCTRFGLD